MALSSEEVLKAAVARIPEIAGIIASLPVEDRPSAFDVAERSYLRTAKYLGGAGRDSLKTNRSDIERDTLNNEPFFNAEIDEESTNKSKEMSSNTPIKVEVTELA